MEIKVHLGILKKVPPIMGIVGRQICLLSNFLRELYSIVSASLEPILVSA